MVQPVVKYTDFQPWMNWRHKTMQKAKESHELSPATGDMSREEFRRFGHELIDWISDYFDHIEELPVLAQIDPGDLKAQLGPWGPIGDAAPLMRAVKSRFDPRGTLNPGRGPWESGQS